MTTGAGGHLYRAVRCSDRTLRVDRRGGARRTTGVRLGKSASEYREAGHSFLQLFAGIAQSVERASRKGEAGCSIHPASTILTERAVSLAAT